MAAVHWRNRYWVVGERHTDVSEETHRVFSSDAPGYVALDDPNYQAFLADGGAAPRVLNDGELSDILAREGAPPEIIRAAGVTEVGACGDALTEDDLLRIYGALGVDADDAIGKWAAGGAWEPPGPEPEPELPPREERPKGRK